MSDRRPYEKFADGSETCIEDEIPFDLPPGWAWARLGNLAETITSGSREWAKYYSETGDLFLRMGNLSRDSFDLRLGSVQHVRPPDNSEGARTCLQPFDLLFSITAEIGLLGLIPEKFGRAFINQHTAMIRFTRIVRGLFLPYVLLAPHMQRVYHAGKHGLKSSFRLDTISSFIIPLPPLSEQHRIIAKIEELMSKVSEYAKAAQQLTEFETRFPAELKRAILQSAVEGKLLPQDPNDEPVEKLLERIADERKSLIKAGKLKRDKHESVIFRGSDRLTYETRDGETVCIEDELPFKIPESWAWVRLGSVATIIRGSVFHGAFVGKASQYTAASASWTRR